METNLVFIDTQAFLQQGLSFDGVILTKIKELGRDGCIRIIISDVVSGEVESHIIDKTGKIFDLKEKMVKEMCLLKYDFCSDIVSSLMAHKKEDYTSMSLGKWRSFLIDSNATVISSALANNEKILKLYFSGKYPFGEKKKKSEFPDALSLLSLETWLEKEGSSSYIISADSDMAGYTQDKESLLSLPGISSFLDIYNRFKERRFEHLHLLIENNIEWVSELIQETFLDSEFSYQGDPTVDVSNVSIVSFSIDDVNVISIVDSFAELVLVAEITCDASIEGPDYDSSIWDREEGHYIYTAYSEGRVSCKDSYVVEMEVDFEDCINEFLSIGIDNGMIILQPA